MRTLAADPAFTLASLVSLAVAIGANTAVFSLLNAVMIRTLPVEDPRALVRVAAKQNSAFTYPIPRPLTRSLAGAPSVRSPRGSAIAASQRDRIGDMVRRRKPDPACRRTHD